MHVVVDWVDLVGKGESGEGQAGLSHMTMLEIKHLGNQVQYTTRGTDGAFQAQRRIPYYRR